MHRESEKCTDERECEKRHLFGLPSRGATTLGPLRVSATKSAASALSDARTDVFAASFPAALLRLLAVRLGLAGVGRVILRFVFEPVFFSLFELVFPLCLSRKHVGRSCSSHGRAMFRH